MDPEHQDPELAYRISAEGFAATVKNMLTAANARPHVNLGTRTVMWAGEIPVQDSTTTIVVRDITIQGRGSFRRISVSQILQETPQQHRTVRHTEYSSFPHLPNVQTHVETISELWFSDIGWVKVPSDVPSHGDGQRPYSLVDMQFLESNIP